MFYPSITKPISLLYFPHSLSWCHFPHFISAKDTSQSYRKQKGQSLASNLLYQKRKNFFLQKYDIVMILLFFFSTFEYIMHTLQCIPHNSDCTQHTIQYYLVYTVHVLSLVKSIDITLYTVKCALHSID